MLLILKDIPALLVHFRFLLSLVGLFVPRQVSAVPEHDVTAPFQLVDSGLDDKQWYHTRTITQNVHMSS
jgi:hypothetical protein